MIKPNHLGICVSDVERSLKFWCDGLGFEGAGTLELGSEWADTLEVGGEVRFTAHYITKEGYTFEILHFDEPTSHGSPSGRRDRIGLTHLAVDVDDLDQAIDHLVACGATVINATRTRSVGEDGVVEVVFVSDPDGVRVELVSTSGPE